MVKKEKIIELYFIEHERVKDIAKKMNISSAYITRVIKEDERYQIEKISRQDLNREKRKNYKNDFMRNKREKKKLEDNYLFIKSQHEQASRELSGGSYLTNENYRKWNSSAYEYNPSKNRYEFDKTLGRSYAVPKYIKERK